MSCRGPPRAGCAVPGGRRAALVGVRDAALLTVPRHHALPDRLQAPGADHRRLGLERGDDVLRRAGDLTADVAVVEPHEHDPTVAATVDDLDLHPARGAL